MSKSARPFNLITISECRRPLKYLFRFTTTVHFVIHARCQSVMCIITLLYYGNSPGFTLRGPSIRSGEKTDDTTRRWNLKWGRYQVGEWRMLDGRQKSGLAYYMGPFGSRKTDMAKIWREDGGAWRGTAS